MPVRRLISFQKYKFYAGLCTFQDHLTLMWLLRDFPGNCKTYLKCCACLGTFGKHLCVQETLIGLHVNLVGWIWSIKMPAIPLTVQGSHYPARILISAYFLSHPFPLLLSPLPLLVSFYSFCPGSPLIQTSTSPYKQCHRSILCPSPPPSSTSTISVAKWSNTLVAIVTRRLPWGWLFYEGRHQANIQY